MSEVRLADVTDRFHYRGRADQTDPRPHRGLLRAPAHMAIWQARGPPLRDECDAQICEGVAARAGWATDWDGAAQAAPDFEVDQRING